MTNGIRPLSWALFGDVRKALAILLLVALWAFQAAAATKAAQTLENVLSEVQKKQKAVNTLQAEFRQEKTLDLLAETQVSAGTFLYAKPDSVRWDYVAPNEVVMLISKGTLTTFYPRLKKAETLEVTRFQDRIFKYMGAGNAIDELSNYFRFRFTEKKDSGSFRLDLAPKTKQIAKRVKSITIWIDRETYLTNRIEYVEGDGDTTLYEFSNIRINEVVDPSRFELELPADVRVDEIRLD